MVEPHVYLLVLLLLLLFCVHKFDRVWCAYAIAIICLELERATNCTHVPLPTKVWMTRMATSTTMIHKILSNLKTGLATMNFHTSIRCSVMVGLWVLAPLKQVLIGGMKTTGVCLLRKLAATGFNEVDNTRKRFLAHAQRSTAAVGFNLAHFM